jgi:hypothetical protein
MIRRGGAGVRLLPVSAPLLWIYPFLFIAAEPLQKALDFRHIENTPKAHIPPLSRKGALGDSVAKKNG